MLRQSQREAGMSALEDSAHWPEQLQEPMAVTQSSKAAAWLFPFGQDPQVKPAHTGP